jgi:hypothetical protein
MFRVAVRCWSRFLRMAGVDSSGADISKESKVTAVLETSSAKFKRIDVPCNEGVHATIFCFVYVTYST